jgi:hypothetical protein
MVFNADRMAQHGPPDRSSNFNPRVESRKKKNDVQSNCPNPHPEVMGKRVRVKFMIKKREEWFNGLISSYNGVTEEYGVYFPSDKQTVEMKLDDEDLEFLDEQYLFHCHI